VSEIHENAEAPFRFFTPFPHHPSRRLRNSACQPCHFKLDARGKSLSVRLILSCSNILGGRFHRLPSKEYIVTKKRCRGDPREYASLVAGRFLTPEKGRQRAVIRRKTSVGRGKAQLFPLQGDSRRLNLQGRFFNFREFHPYNLDEN